MYASIISFRLGVRCDGSDMVGLGFWSSRVFRRQAKRNLSMEGERVDGL